MNLFQAIKSAFLWLKSSSKAKRTQVEVSTARASASFGTDKNLKHADNEAFRGNMILFMHVVSAILSIWCVYSITNTIAQYISKEWAWVPSAIISVIGLYYFETFKSKLMDESAEGIQVSFSEDWKAFALRATLLSIGACTLSYQMCKNGSEDFVKEITDKSSEIETTHDTRKETLENNFSAEKRNATRYHDSIIKAETDAMNAYKEANSWHGKLDASNKTVSKTLANYKEGIDKLGEDKRAELAKLESQKAEKIADLSGTTLKSKVQNSGVVSMYVKYGKYLSLFLEVGLCLLYFERKNYQYLMVKGQSVPKDIQEKIETIGKDAEEVLPKKKVVVTSNDVPKDETTTPPPPRPNLNFYLDGNEQDLQRIYLEFDKEWRGANKVRQAEIEIHLRMITDALSELKKNAPNAVITPKNTVITQQTPVVMPQKEIASPEFVFEVEEDEIYGENTVITFGKAPNNVHYPAKMTEFQLLNLRDRINRNLATYKDYLANDENQRDKTNVLKQIDRLENYLSIIGFFMDKSHYER
jgi:hypothetical protein